MYRIFKINYKSSVVIILSYINEIIVLKNTMKASKEGCVKYGLTNFIIMWREFSPAGNLIRQQKINRIINTVEKT